MKLDSFNELRRIFKSIQQQFQKLQPIQPPVLPFPNKINPQLNRNLLNYKLKKPKTNQKSQKILIQEKHPNPYKKLRKRKGSKNFDFKSSKATSKF